jgi:hypothetical protein
MAATPAQVQRLDPLRLPDLARPGAMPSLPAWVASRIAALRADTQPDPLTGKWRRVQTLPANWTLTVAEREMLSGYVHRIEDLLDGTPANDPSSEQEVLIALTKLMVVLPATAPTELTAEARGEAFLLALEDIPAWATRAAIIRWYRGDAGNDPAGKPYDCHWCPAPADLRRVAYAETYALRSRREDIGRLLRAVPPIQIDDETRRRVRDGLVGLSKTLRASLVGSNGSGEAVGNAPAECADCGTQQRHDPA